MNLAVLPHWTKATKHTHSLTHSLTVAHSRSQSLAPSPDELGLVVALDRGHKHQRRHLNELSGVAGRCERRADHGVVWLVELNFTGCEEQGGGGGWGAQGGGRDRGGAGECTVAGESDRVLAVELVHGAYLKIADGRWVPVGVVMRAPTEGQGSCPSLSQIFTIPPNISAGFRVLSNVKFGKIIEAILPRVAASASWSIATAGSGQTSNALTWDP